MRETENRNKPEAQLGLKSRDGRVAFNCFLPLESIPDHKKPKAMALYRRNRYLAKNIFRILRQKWPTMNFYYSYERSGAFKTNHPHGVLNQEIGRASCRER